MKSILTVVCFLVGCSHPIDFSEIERANKLCAANGGINEFIDRYPIISRVTCNNGAEFILYNKKTKEQ